MLETIKELGNWWIPESPDQKLTGTVTFNPQEGISLDLVGSFEASRDAHNGAEYSVIYGLTSKSGPVTLSKCHNGGWSSHHTPHGGEFVTTKYHADRIFRGMHFPDPERLTLDQVHLSFTHLHAWIGQHRLQIDHTRGEGQGTDNVIIYRTPESIHIETNGISHDFWSDFGVSQSRDNLVLDGASGVELTSRPGLTLEQWLEHAIIPLFEFLSFATGRANGLSQVRFEQAYTQERLAGWSPKDVDVSFLLTANMRYSGLSPRSRPSREAEELVYANDLEDSEWSIYPNWIGFVQRFYSALHLYLLARDYGERFPFFEAQFVSVVQALESYHRQKWGDDDSENNRIALKTRLLELLGEMPGIVKQVHLDLETFVERVVDTRVYFTHLSESMELDRFGPQDAYTAMEALLCAIEVVFLKELGIPLEEGLHRIMQSQRFLAIQKIA